jgi:hypothetical protein
MLSFDNSITFRVESEHFKLKRALETSIEDLKKIINVINLMLKNQRSSYIVTHEEFKSRLARNCIIEALQNLQRFISSYVLRLIRNQMNKISFARSSSDSLSSCTETYNTSMNLSCAHIIQQIEMTDEHLNCSDVYSY